MRNQSYYETDDPVMPFGKYRGRPLTGLPVDYLRWLYDAADIRSAWLREAVGAELNARAGHQQRQQRQPPRGGHPDAQTCDELVSAGLRAMAKRHHPDTGGSHAAMTQVNNAADWLRQQCRAVSP